MSDLTSSTDFDREIEARRLAYLPVIEVMEIRGWKPPPGELIPPYLVWRHADGSMGFLHEEGDTDPSTYWYEKSSFDTPEKMLGVLSHLSQKSWFRPQHVWEMIAIFDELFPGRVEF